MKKKIVVVMNCAAQEIARYLRSSATIRRLYDVTVFTTYLESGDENSKRRLYEAISAADVLIAQNVQNVDWLRNDAMAAYAPPHCRFFRFAFWRFDGFWPIPSPRFAGGLWYLPNEAGGTDNFRDYIGRDIPPASIRSRFDEEITKFARIEQDSELKMLPFLLDNYQYYNLFSDSWHPTPIFFHQVARYILQELDLPADIELLPDDDTNRERYRFVFDAVARELGLKYDRTLLRFDRHEITRDVFFRFCRHAEAHSGKLETPARAADLFSQWCESQGLQVRPYNVAALGRAAQSSLSQWSREGDAQRALTGRDSDEFAFHTELDAAPWWSVDLREFRKVSAILVWNRNSGDPDLKNRAVPLTVSVSTCGTAWKELATIHYPFGSISDGVPLRLDFASPVLARHVRLQVRRPGYLHLARVEVLSNVIAD